MLAFCFTASAVYCFNDIFDSEADRRHPVKCNRPIASGKISKTKAYILMTFMIILAVATLFFLPTKLIETAAVIGVYFVMNICYCGWLKRFAIIDVCVVATGKPDTTLTLTAQNVGIGQSDYMAANDKTEKFTVTYELSGNTMQYTQETILHVYGKPFTHTDISTLTRV